MSGALPEYPSVTPEIVVPASMQSLLEVSANISST